MSHSRRLRRFGPTTPTRANRRPFWRYGAARQPFGLGYQLADIDAIIAERKDARKMAREAVPLAAHGEIGNGHSRESSAFSTMEGNNTTATNTLRRLARDNPDILSRVESGELSPHAAAVEAGIRKKSILHSAQCG